MPRTLLWQQVFSFRDYNGENAETNIYLEAPPTQEGLNQFVETAGIVLSGVSDAYNYQAEVRKSFPPTTPQVIKGTASSYDRLLILCREGENYAKITIPAPSPQPYLTQGPFRGFKVDKSNPANVAAIQALVDILAQTLTPAGNPFPTGEWSAALMVPQL